MEQRRNSMSAQQTIYLASRTEGENHLLRMRLEPVIIQLGLEFAGLSFVSTLSNGILASPECRDAGIIILNFALWTPRDLVLAEEVRAFAEKSTMLILAKFESSRPSRESKSLAEAIFLEKPINAREVTGILRKRLLEGGVAQQVHRRFTTDEFAEVLIERQGEPFASRVVNLSKGGAFLEFLTEAPVQVGDGLKVRVQLNDVKRTYTMPAKVVWMKEPAAGGGTGVGVEFTGPAAVSKTILGS
jgi:Tfp pilus assembly protein PilZ